MTDFDAQSDRSKLFEGKTEEERAALKAAEPGGGGGPNSKYFSGAKKPFHLHGTDLFGDEIKADAKGALRERFDFPPFTVLNAREGAWQDRKRAWLACGIQSEVGRGENLLKMSDTLLEPDPEKRAAMQAARANPETSSLKGGLTFGTSIHPFDKTGEARNAAARGDARTFGSGDPGDLAAGFKRRETGSLSDGLVIGTTTDPYRKAGEEVEGAGGSGTSIFDPVLTELCYRWFCPPGGLILDPFAGGSVRGIVAGLLDFRYHGIDLRPEQIEANEAQRQLICPDADINWVVGDSNEMLKTAPEADFVFSCPPYGDLEQYSDDPKDLSAMTWEGFVGFYRSIIRKAVDKLKPNRFACFVIGEYRDKETGLYRGFVPLTCAAFMAAGAALYNEAILITAVGSLPIRVTKQFETSRKLGKTHQNIIICVKGDPKIAAEAIRNPASQAGRLAPIAIRPAKEEKPPQATPGADFRPFSAPSDGLKPASSDGLKPAPAESLKPAEAIEPALPAAGTLMPFPVPEPVSVPVAPSALDFALKEAPEVTVPEPMAPAPLPEYKTLEVVNRPTGSLADFLGSVPRSTTKWTPQEPPILDGISDIVLNFATNGLDWNNGHHPVGVTVSTLDGQLTRFLPFAFEGGGNLDEAVVKSWYHEQVKGKKIHNANTRFELHMSRWMGASLEDQGCTFTDIMHTAALLDDNRKRFALDVLAADFLPNEPVVGRLDERSHSRYGADEVAERELYTAKLVGRLHDAMYPELAKQELGDVQQLEDEVIPVVVEMEKNGSPLDVELMEQYFKECNDKYGALMLEIANDVGFNFDHSSSGWQRLFEQCGIPPSDSYKEEVLAGIEHPVIRKAHLAGQYASLNSKTFAAYRKLVGPDGILRYDINQLRGDEGGTVSGRFSIGYVQQVPNHDNHFAVFGEELYPRRLYIADRTPIDGWIPQYFEADAAQIEYRLFANLANNKQVLEAYAKDPKMSFHRMTWDMMKVYKPDMLYSHQKNFNFAYQYGAKMVKLAVMMKFITAAEGEEIRANKRWSDPRLDKIKEILSVWAKVMPEGDELLNRASHLAKAKCDKFCKPGDKLHRQYQHRGYIKTMLGRRSRFPDNYKTYIALNRVLQGTGADIMKRKLVELHNARKDTGLLMRLSVHDAVTGDARMPETMSRVNEILNRQSFETKVPILWECKQGPNWADAT